MAMQTMELIRPKIDTETAKKLAFDLYGLKAIQISELNGYDDKNFHLIMDLNFNKNAYIEKVYCAGYVLKVINTLDSQNLEWFEAQTKLLMFLNKSNIRCPKPVLTKHKKQCDIVSLSSGNHVVRLLEFIPGNILFKLPNPGANIFYQVGVFTAKIDRALKDLNNGIYQKDIKWCLGAAPEIINYIHLIDGKYKVLVEDTISEFSRRVLSIDNQLAKGIIHGDINEQNLIVDNENDEAIVKAVIDFGDTHFCCYLYELALAMTYMIFLSNDIDTAGHVLRGYCSVIKITDVEFNLLKICIMTRLCQSLVLGAYASLQNPDNEYVLTTAKRGWGLLERLRNESEESVLTRWRTIVS